MFYQEVSLRRLKGGGVKIDAAGALGFAVLGELHRASWRGQHTAHLEKKCVKDSVWGLNLLITTNFCMQQWATMAPAPIARSWQITMWHHWVHDHHKKKFLNKGDTKYIVALYLDVLFFKVRNTI